MKKQCGQAGNGVYLLMKGGCGKDMDIEETYRCIGCGKWFHLDCIFNHFEQEEGQDYARYYLKKIQERTKDNIIKRFCRLGLERKKPTITLPKLTSLSIDR
jgi:hypothetical protein